MYNFIVLGQVPGTNVQISFQAWLVLMALLAIMTPVVWAQLKRRWQELEAVIERQPLHASQLHQRLHLTAR